MLLSAYAIKIELCSNPCTPTWVHLQISNQMAATQCIYVVKTLCWCSNCELQERWFKWLWQQQKTTFKLGATVWRLIKKHWLFCWV